MSLFIVCKSLILKKEQTITYIDSLLHTYTLGLGQNDLKSILKLIYHFSLITNTGSYLWSKNRLSSTLNHSGIKSLATNNYTALQSILINANILASFSLFTVYSVGLYSR